jgi:2-keto-4-pentenoate hydratase/2-oxohepta-3-ene-1,7-dioic acid hydratase in catechol pathway
MYRLRVKNSGDFINVQNVYCIGKNYPEHIKEFENTDKFSAPGEPVVFLKPNSAVTCGDCEVTIPKLRGEKISGNLQNEVELVIVIGKNGRDIQPENAGDYILGYAVGIDFTLRDIQMELKKKGLPWTLSKGFIGSAPVSEVVYKKETINPDSLKITLSVNNVVKQNDTTSSMLFNVSYLIHYISSIFGVQEGDLIFSGTPAGVTKLNPGDFIDAEIESIGKLKIKIV